VLNPTDFAINFPGAVVPPALRKLLEFENQSKGYYSSGFELTVDDKGGLRTWSKDPAFLDALTPFANATGGGSFYALWSEGPAQDLAEAAVIAFGDEGGVHVVAENVRALLQLLTFDEEPMIDFEKVTFYRGPEHRPSAGAGAYKAWLRKEFNLDPIDDAMPLVTAAQEKHGVQFDAWKSKFLDK
jgi:hypothetical protein